MMSKYQMEIFFKTYVKGEYFHIHMGGYICTVTSFTLYKLVVK